MSSVPEPPFLVIRPAIAFWVERDPITECTATVQAVREGCFDEAACYDRTGGEWPIEGSRYRQDPTLRSRLLPWTRIPVELRLAARRTVSPGEIVARLTDVLQSDTPFREALGRPPDELRALFTQAETAAEIIRIAELACD